jgi:exocyst complex component 6
MTEIRTVPSLEVKASYDSQQYVSNPFDDDSEELEEEESESLNVSTSKMASQTPTNNAGLGTFNAMNPQESRSKRLREEAIRRLVQDIQRTASSASSFSMGLDSSGDDESEEELIIAATLATAIERGLDKDLHNELCKQVKDSASNISKICHDHSDQFLDSVTQVADLGIPCNAIRNKIEYANSELEMKVLGPMLDASRELEYVKFVRAKCQTAHALVLACHRVAMLLEKAKKQANLARPRVALACIDEARSCLSASLASLVCYPSTGGVSKRNVNNEEIQKILEDLFKDSGMDGNAGDDNDDRVHDKSTTSKDHSKDKKITKSKGHVRHEKTDLRLEDTPFGIMAMKLVPRIENEVLMGARRALNKWFLAIRSGGDGAKAGRAALRKCAASMAMGPGQLGIGGKVQGYTWRAKNADNLISRVDQSGKVARATRMGYWFDRDNAVDMDRLARLSDMGMERKAEAFASAFGWYRCWNETSSLEVDEAKSISESDGFGSRHGDPLMSGSRHGKSLSFRASTSRADPSNLRVHNRRGPNGQKEYSPWALALTPNILLDDSMTRAEDEEKLSTLPESVHPVRAAKDSFAMLGKSEEFRQYYEQNRFGDMKIGDKSEGGIGREMRSSLSSLTGDDVSHGTDRIFFARSLPHFCTSVVGFSAIEAALELGDIRDVDESENKPLSEDDTKAIISFSELQQSSSSRLSSARYENKLIGEIGTLLRHRAIGATLTELSRSSCLITAFKAALKIVHPSSVTRGFDKELLSMDVDILMTGLKVAQGEQKRATSHILKEDSKEPMRVNRSELRYTNSIESSSAIPSEEVVDLPFGLADMKQKVVERDSFLDEPSMDNVRTQLSKRSTLTYQSSLDTDTYNFSQAVPAIVRSIHARSIAFAAFAMSQQELGQVFPSNNGVGVAGYVLDCIEQCVSIAAIAIKDGYEHLDELSVPEAVQLTANIASLQGCLPRLFGTLIRGLCHVGMVPEGQLNETFKYADAALGRADKSCDQQVASMFNSVFELCRNKIDTLLHFSLDNFQWVAKSTRYTPNTYCDSLIDYLRKIFHSLKSLDEGSRTGLHFSCCGHISERLVMLISGKISTEDDTGIRHDETNGLVPISKIDAYGLKNLSTDVAEFESFADGTGVPQLRDCFTELRCIVDALLDKDLPMLLQPENEHKRRRKYPFLNIEKVCNILEKYQGPGMSLGSKFKTEEEKDFLVLEKKDIAPLIKAAKIQI